MNKNKRSLILGDDGEILNGELAIPEKPKRSSGRRLRRLGYSAVAVLLILMVGAALGIIGYNRIQTPSSPVPDPQSIVGILPSSTSSPTSTSTRTLVPTATFIPRNNTSTQTPILATATPSLPPTATVIPQATNSGQTAAPHSATHILWVSSCDPRTDTRHCSLGNINIFNEFYSTIQNLGADIVYALPTSSAEMFNYDVVVLSYCDLGASALPVKLFQDYVAGGGSLMVMGDNFCLGVHVLGRWGSSAEAASLLTMTWGISFTTDDDFKNSNFTTFIGHPLTAGIKTIYSFRHAYLTVQAPATTIAWVNNRPVIAVYDGTGTVIAVPDTSFEWGSSFKSQIASADNFAFWQNSFVWLSKQVQAKHS